MIGTDKLECYITIDWKGLPGTNTLAYCAPLLGCFHQLDIYTATTIIPILSLTGNAYYQPSIS
jgi:hypothetical protein